MTLFISLSSLACKGQEYPDISYEEVESSRKYVNGNLLQKDLLLYSKTFELSHPYYADKKHVRELKKETKKLYKDFAEIDDIKTFRCGHQDTGLHIMAMYCASIYRILIPMQLSAADISLVRMRI